MKKIETKINMSGIVMNVRSNQSLSSELIEVIEGLKLNIMWSDASAKHYSMDEKIADKVWLENIFYNNELTEAEALILQ